MLFCFWTLNAHTASWIWSEMDLLPSLLACFLLGLGVIVLAADLSHGDSTALGRKFGTLRKKLALSLSTKTQRVLTTSQKNEGRTTLAPISSMALSFLFLLIYWFTSSDRR